MIVSKNDIVSGLSNLGIRKGDILLVHSSMKSFGHVDGGARTIINGLIDAIGDNGALMMPAFTGKRSDSVDNPPVFDVRETQCWTGKVSEEFRCYSGTIRSLHPTHSVSVIGYKGEKLIGDHQNGKSPCDEHSPFFLNAKLGGYILLLGVDNESNTTIHSCEEIAGVPYHLQHELCNVDIKGYKGETIRVSNRLHNWYKKPTDFNKLMKVFEYKCAVKKCMIGKSVVISIKAEAMLKVSVEILKKNPLFLQI